jgi:hypothetical protein
MQGADFREFPFSAHLGEYSLRIAGGTVASRGYRFLKYRAIGSRTRPAFS